VALTVFGGSREVHRLSEWLAPVQEVLLRHGYRRLYIGGSSSREILDHIFFGAGIALRDLDVYLLKHATVRAEDISVLCDDMRDLGFGGIGPVREKRRANPALQGAARYQYLAGYGVHLFSQENPILSLGVLHHDSDLALNGLFDIDTTLLVVDNDRPFHRYAAQVARGRRPNLVLDPHDGYRAWRQRSPQVVHWTEVERCFARNSFRLVRGLAKASRLRLPTRLADDYRERRPETVLIDDPVELHRDLLKVLGDRHWAEELAMLAQLGALSVISTSLQTTMELMTPSVLRRTTPSPTGARPHELSLVRAKMLCGDSALLESLRSVAASVFGPT
jgi:hypothetical protein